MNREFFQSILPRWKHGLELKGLFLIAAIFFSFMLLFSLNRYYTFYTSYDHGLFNQLFFNNLHGKFFQSSLSAGNSIETMGAGKIPAVGFLHLGQHFVPDFLLWLPIYALLPNSVTLVVLQVGLMTAAGLVLYPLARHYLQPNLSLLITASYYGAGAVIGPTFANFYEQCQIPLFTFSCLLALEKRCWWLFWVLAVLVLGIREDAGFVLFGVGLYLLLSRRHPRIGIALCLLSFGYITIVTNVIMPHISEDSSRLYLASRFRNFVDGNPNPSTLQVFWGMVSHPQLLLVSLLTPLEGRVVYLIRHWLPLMFIPVISPVTWILTGVPLLSVLFQDSMQAFTIWLRYAIPIVPGLFYGSILWWAAHGDRFKPRVKHVWIGCISLSIVLVLESNPSYIFYFLLPSPTGAEGGLTHASLVQFWQHSDRVNQVIRVIPADASISATTHLIPPLSSRRSMTRLPDLKLQDDAGQIVSVESLAADLWRLKAIRSSKVERSRLQAVVPLVERLLRDATYGLLDVQDGVILMQKGTLSDPKTLMGWKQLHAELEPFLRD